ncbi:hypothetical protein EZI54_02755 [Marinobacter halodurans]|uniref:Uncharacterized protein n=1 Tax=Marinobacter halodurans TaxID=2528979 RepID=A0ABY1ZPK8_9GAMM|nr:hypothetical protein [Marinobacter halodurans]TBW58806.1 hypothetical protein EZI54_02755 [Marinobacter halodurans]
MGVCLACPADTLDWHYHQDGIQPPVIQPVSPDQADSGSQTDSLPPLLASPQYADDSRGWSLISPQVTTGRPDAFVDRREAVRINQQAQDQSRLNSAHEPVLMDSLPEALRGLDYRLEMGLRYRW